MAMTSLSCSRKLLTPLGTRQPHKDSHSLHSVCITIIIIIVNFFYLASSIVFIEATAVNIICILFNFPHTQTTSSKYTGLEQVCCIHLNRTTTAMHIFVLLRIIIIKCDDYCYRGCEHADPNAIKCV